MQRIFILIPWFHPAYKAGGPVQSVANMVQQMDTYAFNFSIFSSNRDLDGSLLTNVEWDTWIYHTENSKIWYSSNNDILKVIKHAINEEKPDILFSMGIYSWAFNFKPLLFCKGVKKIISVNGMLHPGALSQKGFKKKLYLQLWKILGLHKKYIFHATDEKEKKHIQEVFGEKTTVKIAVDFPGVFPLQPVIKKKTAHVKLISVALISPMKNFLLILQALALTGSKHVDCLIEYAIYGPVKEKLYWEQCLALIKEMPANISIQYYGDVHPARVMNVLSQNHVFILPSKSENFGHAIYEALSAGRPVITSNATPWNNLHQAKAGINVSVDDIGELVKAINYFAAMNQETLQEWSNGARQYAERAIDMDMMRRQYGGMFRD